jgi:hypothetical protein
MITITGIEETFNALKAQLKKEETLALEKESFRLVNNLKNATPVDTGMARDSWRRNNRSDVVEVINDIEYIEALNEGHSKQAPSHFIESEALKIGKPIGSITKSFK